jgi:hypothetical protein
MPTTTITREPGADVPLSTFFDSTIATVLRNLSREAEFEGRPFTRRLLEEAAQRLKATGK